MKKVISLILIIQASFAFSQQLEKLLPVNFKRSNDVFQIVEEEKKQVSLFFSDKNRVLSVRLNESFEVIDSLSSARPSKEYNDIVGYSISGNKYYSYWTNSNNKEVVAQCFNFDSKTVSLKPFSITFEKEKPIKTITVNNIFYLITVVKSSSTLNFYVFQDGNLEKKSVDLSDKRFLTYDTKTCNLWELLNTGTGFESALSVQNISNDTPPSLTFSANKRKAYAYGNELFFTFDNNKNFTQTIKINLSDFSVVTKVYTQPYLQSVNYVNDESNSFYINGKLIQMKLNENRLALSVKDMEGNELKSYEILKDKEVAFKNSDIIQENGGINNTRILDKSNQLLRKIYYEYPSMSCYSFNDTVYLTIGGVSLEKSGNAAMYGGMFGLAGAIIGTAIASNYSLANLNSYKNRKVIYINCLFDKDFNHVEGNVNKLAFDKLRALSEKKDDLISQSVFKFNSKLYFGGYDKQEKSYKFFSFTD